MLWNSILAGRGLTADRADEDIAAGEFDGDDVCVINRRDWYRTMVWCPNLMVEVLEAAEIAGRQRSRGQAGAGPDIAVYSSRPT